MFKIKIDPGKSLCPMCREAISREASICPHCRSDLREREDWKVQPTQPVQQGGCAAMLVVGAIGLSGLAGVGLSLLR